MSIGSLPKAYRLALFNLFEWFEDEIQCTWTSRGNSLFFPESPDQYIFLFLRGANTVSYTTYMYHRRLFHTNLFHTNIIIVVWKIVYETSACALYIVNRVQYVNNIHGNLNLFRRGFKERRTGRTPPLKFSKIRVFGDMYTFT